MRAKIEILKAFIKIHSDDAVEDEYINMCDSARVKVGELEEVLEDVLEIAFGDNALNKGYGKDELVSRLREFSDKALKYDEAMESFEYSIINMP